MDRIKLSNGRTVVAAMVNYEYLMDIAYPFRKGMGAVICKQGNNPDKPYVVWTVYPPDGGVGEHWMEFPWIAEHGEYDLTWEQAVAEMQRRWTQYGIWQNLGEKDYSDTEPF
jgi:hypothetical protein